MKTPRIELICVGSELLMGKVNTHGAYLSQVLESLGLVLRRETTVSDDLTDMREAFSEVWRRADVVLCSGGLGPTFDDLTRDAWAKVLKRSLVFNSGIARGIEAKFRRRSLKMPPENKRQAYVLRGAQVLENHHGTAPGQLLEAGHKILVLLPGPGRELIPMVEGSLTAFLERRFPGRERETRVYRIFGMPESAVDEKMRPLVRSEKSRGGVQVTWGILAHNFIVDMKVTASASRTSLVKARLDSLEKRLLRIFPEDIYGRGQETVEQVVGRLLVARGATVAVAESCTGGLLAEKLTRVPGISAHFERGYITYSNKAKQKDLGVKAATLARDGAVSPACAFEMAVGCRRRSGARYALAVTGIAGPDGGSPQKPVGLVYIALAGPDGVRGEERIFPGDRQQVRERAALTALDMLRRRLAKRAPLKKNPLTPSLAIWERVN